MHTGNSISPTLQPKPYTHTTHLILEAASAEKSVRLGRKRGAGHRVAGSVLGSSDLLLHRHLLPRKSRSWCRARRQLACRSLTGALRELCVRWHVRTAGRVRLSQIVHQARDLVIHLGDLVVHNGQGPLACILGSNRVSVLAIFLEVDLVLPSMCCCVEALLAAPLGLAKDTLAVLGVRLVLEFVGTRARRRGSDGTIPRTHQFIEKAVAAGFGDAGLAARTQRSEAGERVRTTVCPSVWGKLH